VRANRLQGRPARLNETSPDLEATMAARGTPETVDELLTQARATLPHRPSPARALRRRGITSIPTLMAFRDGILVFSQPGALPAAALKQLIQAVRDLDMDQVRAGLVRQQAEGTPR
jgi:hypothetical protein